MTQIGLDEPVDFTIPQGENYDLIVEAFADDAQTTRAAIDLANYVVTAQLRRHRGAAWPLLSLSSDDGKIFVEDAVEDPPGQWIRVHFDAADSMLLTSGGVWGAALVDRNDPSNVVMIQEGRFGLRKFVMGG